MDQLDIAAEIAALRSTFADIESVVDPDRLRADIADLSEQAGVPNLWDDPAAAGARARLLGRLLDHDSHILASDKERIAYA